MARKRVVEAPSLHSWEDVNDALRQIAEAQIALGEIQSDRGSWRSHVHRTYIAQRVQLFKPSADNGGVKGQGPLRSLGGSKGGHSLT